VERIGDAASDGLWDPRPRGSQLAAVASVQSTVVDSRDELVERFRLLDEQTAGGPVPRPAIWGGYRVVPETVEFWQGGQDRLHDRLKFVRDDAEGGGWNVQRLAPRRSRSRSAAGGRSTPRRCATRTSAGSSGVWPPRCSASR
jgi:pyridoxamine 5'-phosphate oxidase